MYSIQLEYSARAHHAPNLDGQLQGAPLRPLPAGAAQRLQRDHTAVRAEHLVRVRVRARARVRIRVRIRARVRVRVG